MVRPLQSSEEKLHDLGKALDELDRKNAPPAAPMVSKPKPRIELGSKTKLALQIMGWGFGLFWLLWLALALIVSPPDQISDLVVVPFSAFLCWLIFQFHRLILISIVHKASGSR